MAREITLVALAPQTIEGILNSISTVGAYTEAEYEAVGLVEMLRERLGRRSASGASAPGRAARVVVLEGLGPAAGGRPLGTGDGPARGRLGAARAGGRVVGGRRPGTRCARWSRRCSCWRSVAPTPPVLTRRSNRSSLPAWFDELEAVRDGEFFAVDGAGLFARPGPRVIEGIAVLAELFDPEVFAGAGPVEAWRPLAPVGIADRHSDRRPADRA